MQNHVAFFSHPMQTLVLYVKPGDDHFFPQCFQLTVIRLIPGISKYESCRQKFKDDRILTVTSIYVLEFLCYIKKYRGGLKHNCEIHEYNIRGKYDLQTQSAIHLYSKTVCYIWV